MLVKVNPSFALLCFHNTTHSCIRTNDNGDLILNTNMQVAWKNFLAPFRITTA